MRTRKFVHQCLCALLVLGLGLTPPTAPSIASGPGGPGGGPAQGLSSMFGMFFGNPKSQRVGREAVRRGVSAEVCEDYDGASPVGQINTILCHLEKSMGITGPGNYTKTFGETSLRAEIAEVSTSVSLDGKETVYNYSAQVWACHGSCGSVSDFNRLFYMAFSKDSSGAASKGFLLADFGAFGGFPGSNAMKVQFDLDSSSSTQFVNAQAFVDMSAMPGPSRSPSSTFTMDSRATRDSTALKINMVHSSGINGMRFAAAKAVSESTTTDFRVYFEMPGYSEPSDPSEAIPGLGEVDYDGDIGAKSACLSVEESDSEFSEKSEGTCSGLSLNPFALKVSDLVSYDVNSVLTTSTLWNGMQENPSAL